MSDVHRERFGDLAAESYGTPDDRPPLVLLHGLTYDRGQWRPAIDQLEIVDPDRRVVAFDLPGHGESPPRESYQSDEITAVIHDAVIAAGLEAPVVVGHSLGGVLATIYAAAYPSRGAINVDQPLLPGPFAATLRRLEPVLRSSDYLQVWDSMLASMEIDQLPPDAQYLVSTATTPAQELLLGYWNELLVTPTDRIDAQRGADLAAIQAKGIPYQYVSGIEPPPAYRQWLTDALPEVTITILPRSGHFPHLVYPGEFAAILAAAPRH